MLSLISKCSAILIRRVKTPLKGQLTFSLIQSYQMLHTCFVAIQKLRLPAKWVSIVFYACRTSVFSLSVYAYPSHTFAQSTKCIYVLPQSGIWKRRQRANSWTLLFEFESTRTLTRSMNGILRQVYYRIHGIKHQHWHYHQNIASLSSLTHVTHRLYIHLISFTFFFDKISSTHKSVKELAPGRRTFVAWLRWKFFGVWSAKQIKRLFDYNAFASRIVCKQFNEKAYFLHNAQLTHNVLKTKHVSQNAKCYRPRDSRSHNFSLLYFASKHSILHTVSCHSHNNKIILAVFMRMIEKKRREGDAHSKMLMLFSLCLLYIIQPPRLE